MGSDSGNGKDSAKVKAEEKQKVAEEERQKQDYLEKLSKAKGWERFKLGSQYGYKNWTGKQSQHRPGEYDRVLQRKLKQADFMSGGVYENEGRASQPSGAEASQQDDVRRAHAERFHLANSASPKGRGRYEVPQETLGDSVGPLGLNASADVAKVQEGLNAAGLNVEADGVISTETVNKTKAFQQENGLKVDGQVNPGGPTEKALQGRLNKSGEAPQTQPGQVSIERQVETLREMEAAKAARQRQQQAAIAKARQRTSYASAWQQELAKPPTERRTPKAFAADYHKANGITSGYAPNAKQVASLTPPSTPNRQTETAKAPTPKTTQATAAARHANEFEGVMKHVAAVNPTSSAQIAQEFHPAYGYTDRGQGLLTEVEEAIRTGVDLKTGFTNKSLDLAMQYADLPGVLSRSSRFGLLDMPTKRWNASQWNKASLHKDWHAPMVLGHKRQKHDWFNLSAPVPDGIKNEMKIVQHQLNYEASKKSSPYDYYNDGFIGAQDGLEWKQDPDDRISLKGGFNFHSTSFVVDGPIRIKPVSITFGGERHLMRVGWLELDQNGKAKPEFRSRKSMERPLWGGFNSNLLSYDFTPPYPEKNPHGYLVTITSPPQDMTHLNAGGFEVDIYTQEDNKPAKKEKENYGGVKFY